MSGFPYNVPYDPGPTMFSIGWGEDIDLSGGGAAIATVLAQQPDFRDGSDDLLPTVDMFIKRIWYADETVGDVSGARLSSDKAFHNTRTIHRFKQETSAEFPVMMHEFPGRGFHIPAGTKLSFTGSSGGAGAEQHVAILDCWSPSFKLPITKGNPDAGGIFISHGLKTGTLVAATISGKNDILGHISAYEDSEQSFGVEQNAKYTVYGLSPRPGLAAVGVMGFLHPSGLYSFLRPTGAAAVDTPVWFPMDQPWAFNGAEKSAPRLVGAGAVITSTEFQPLFVRHV